MHFSLQLHEEKSGCNFWQVIEDAISEEKKYQPLLNYNQVDGYKSILNYSNSFPSLSHKNGSFKWFIQTI